MKRHPALIFIAALVVGLAASAVVRAAEPVADGQWQPLFNGKDLTGWVPMNGASFTVTNGNLRLLSGTGWLRSAKPYTNFVLEAEWRALVPGYDSGFFLRAGAEGKPWPSDVWQLNLARNAVGALLKGSQTRVPAETPPVPLNRWVKVRVEAKGSKLTLDVDGERVWEFSGFDAASGYLGIQAEDKAFDFRNLRVMELP